MPRKKLKKKVRKAKMDYPDLRFERLDNGQYEAWTQTLCGTGASGVDNCPLKAAEKCLAYAHTLDFHALIDGYL